MSALLLVIGLYLAILQQYMTKMKIKSIFFKLIPCRKKDLFVALANFDTSLKCLWIHVLNPHLGWLGRGLTNPSQTLITQRQIAEGCYSVVKHMISTLCLCVCMSAFVCARPLSLFLWLLSDTGVTPGYGCIVPPRFLAQSLMCVWERAWHLPQIFVLAAGRPLSRVIVKRSIDQLIDHTVDFSGSALLHWVISLVCLLQSVRLLIITPKH